MNRFDLLHLYRRLDLASVPLKPRSKDLLGHRGDRWDPSIETLRRRFGDARVNIGVRCSDDCAFRGCDSEGTLRNSTATRDLPPTEAQSADVVELLDALGTKPGAARGERMGLYLFGYYRLSSPRVDRLSGLLHRFGCSKGGYPSKSQDRWGSR